MSSSSHKQTPGSSSSATQLASPNHELSGSNNSVEKDNAMQSISPKASPRSKTVTLVVKGKFEPQEPSNFRNLAQGALSKRSNGKSPFDFRTKSPDMSENSSEENDNEDVDEEKDLQKKHRNKCADEEKNEDHHISPPRKKRSFHSDNECSIDRRVYSKNPSDPNQFEQLHVDALSFAIDKDPILYFQDKKNQISPFLEKLRRLSKISTVLNIYHFNHAFSIFYNTFEIQVKNQNSLIIIYLPFALAYFMMSLPPLVQLFVSHELVLHFFEYEKKLPSHLSYEDFFSVIDLLIDERSPRVQVVLKQQKVRKSLFHNSQFNAQFDEESEQKNNFQSELTLALKAIKDTHQQTEQTNTSSEKHSLVSKNDKEDNSSPSSSSSSSSCSKSSSDSSESSSESFSESFEEMELSKTSPFEQKYSQLTHCSNSVHISVKKPYASYLNGKEEMMPPQFVFDIFTKFHRLSLI